MVRVTILFVECTSDIILIIHQLMSVVYKIIFPLSFVSQFLLVLFYSRMKLMQLQVFFVASCLDGPFCINVVTRQCIMVTSCKHNLSMLKQFSYSMQRIIFNFHGHTFLFLVHSSIRVYRQALCFKQKDNARFETMKHTQLTSYRSQLFMFVSRCNAVVCSHTNSNNCRCASVMFLSSISTA